MFTYRIWNNHGNSKGPHNWRYEQSYRDALIPQDKAMNDRHLEELRTEWLLSHKPPRNVVVNPALMAEWKRMADAKANEWARRMEPHRFLNPMYRRMNGIPADTNMRRDVNGNTAVLSSSWVGDAIVKANGNMVTFNLGGKDYDFAMNEIGGKEGLTACLSSPSIGRYIATNWIGKLPSSVKNSPQYKAKSKRGK